MFTILHRTCQGMKFRFRLVYPELGFYNEWLQSSDPTEEEAVEGFQRERGLKDILKRNNIFFVLLYIPALQR